jgi:hypothetical protein
MWEQRPPGAVVFKYTDTLLDEKFATTKSFLPSPFISAIETEIGKFPAVNSILSVKVGTRDPVGVVFSKTETVPENRFATAMSSLPSPLRSPIATEYG